MSLTVLSDKGWENWFCTYIKIAYPFRSRNNFPLLFIFPANNFVGFFVNCINSWRVGCSRLGFSDKKIENQKLILQELVMGPYCIQYNELSSLDYFLTGSFLFSLIAVSVVGSNFQQLWQLCHTIAYTLNKLQVLDEKSLMQSMADISKPQWHQFWIFSWGEGDNLMW